MWNSLIFYHWYLIPYSVSVSVIPFPFPDSGFRIPCFSAAVFVGFVERKESGIKGRFPFNKNSGLKFREFYVFNGTVHSGCTDPTQATARLVIVLASRIQKSGTGDNNFVKWKGTFRSDRPKWLDRSKRTTFKAGPEYSGRTKPKWYVPFDVATEITGILGWMESAQESRMRNSQPFQMSPVGAVLYGFIVCFFFSLAEAQFALQ